MKIREVIKCIFTINICFKTVRHLTTQFHSILRHIFTFPHISFLPKHPKRSKLCRFLVPNITNRRFFYSIMTSYVCVIMTFLQHVEKFDICVMVSFFLCLLGAITGAFITGAERFIDTRYLSGKNIQQLRVTLLVIGHLCKLSKLNAFCTVLEM